LFVEETDNDEMDEKSELLDEIVSSMGVTLEAADEDEDDAEDDDGIEQ
jgi:hypothetical protein